MGMAVEMAEGSHEKTASSSVMTAPPACMACVGLQGISHLTCASSAPAPPPPRSDALCSLTHHGAGHASLRPGSPFSMPNCWPPFLLQDLSWPSPLQGQSSRSLFSEAPSLLQPLNWNSMSHASANVAGPRAAERLRCGLSTLGRSGCSHCPFPGAAYSLGLPHNAPQRGDFNSTLCPPRAGAACQKLSVCRATTL